MALLPIRFAAGLDKDEKAGASVMINVSILRNAADALDTLEESKSTEPEATIATARESALREAALRVVTSKHGSILHSPDSTRTDIHNDILALIDQPAPDRNWLSTGIGDVITERCRQGHKGFDADHDDQNTMREMPRAAVCYVLGNAGNWPVQWDRRWWKPTDERRNLVKAAALLIAEIERLDRVALADAPAT